MYTAKYLQSALANPKLASLPSTHSIDVIERLPTPFGLVRSGVAPDHPEVKSVEKDFREVFERNIGDSSSSSRQLGVAFRGNVEVGRDISLEELRRLYDIVVLAYGCDSDRRLGIPGEDLQGVVSAREFVGWYNGHPRDVDLTEPLSELLSNPAEKSVSVIGQGNVALDCARVLAKGGEGLRSTDISAHSLPVLGGGVGKVTVLGRRGHVQGAFTIKELRELTKLSKEGHGVSFHVREDELDLGMTDSSRQELEGRLGRPKGRINKLLRAAAAVAHDPKAAKEVHLRFLLNPVEFVPDTADPTFVGSIICERTRLGGDPGKQSAVATGEYETIPTHLALTSIGYKGKALPGMGDIFNESEGVIVNQNGQIYGADESTGAGLYCSGWIKRGPSGIIGTNISDAKETVASILRDISTDVAPPHIGREQCNHGREGLDAILKERETQVVDWPGYIKIDLAEKSASNLRHEDQPREKMTRVEDMLAALRAL